MPNVMTAIQSIFATRLSAMRRTKDEGATAVEYGLMVALIAGVIVLAVSLLGGQVKDSFNDTCKEIKNAGTTATATCAP